MLAVRSSMLVCPQCGSVYTRELDFCGLDGKRLTQSEQDPLVGRTVDRYRVIAFVGAGGMARVYKAEHVYLEQHFALKVLHGEIASDRDLSRRFHREAKALCRIKHENIVTVADFGATREGLLFMVMEFLDGPTLSAILKAQGKLPPDRTALIAHQLAAGLSAAHEQGYVHRDLKPGNVVVVGPSNQQTVKILDFGLVRIVEREDEPTRLTQHGMFFGTPAYMAPEQITGEEVGPSADLYALGILLYQMLTGNLPFHGDIKALAHHHVSTRPVRPEEDFGGLTDLALDLLEKSPADRPADARGVMRRLEELSFLRTDDRVPLPRPPLSEIKDEVELSTPVIAEERSLIEQTAGEDPREMSRSIREAIGLRAYIGGWVPVALFVAFAAAVSFFWLLSERTASQSESSTAPAAAEPAERVAMSPVAAEPKPIKAKRQERKPSAPARTSRTSRKASTAAEVEPPPRPEPKAEPTRAPPMGQTEARPSSPGTPTAQVDRVGARAPVPPPPAAPSTLPPTPPSTPPPRTESEVRTIETVVEALEPAEPILFNKSFRDLDLAIGWALSRRGLAWEDLTSVEPTAARRWMSWYEATEEPPTLDLSETFQTLESAVGEIEIDSRLLQVKLSRIRHGIESAEGVDSSARLSILRDRYRALRRDVGLLPMPRSPNELAAELTLLESDVKVVEAEVRRHRQRQPGAPLEIPKPLLEE